MFRVDAKHEISRQGFLAVGNDVNDLKCCHSFVVDDWIQSTPYKGSEVADQVRDRLVGCGDGAISQLRHRRVGHWMVIYSKQARYVINRPGLAGGTVAHSRDWPRICMTRLRMELRSLCEPTNEAGTPQQARWFCLSCKYETKKPRHPPPATRHSRVEGLL